VAAPKEYCVEHEPADDRDRIVPPGRRKLSWRSRRSVSVRNPIDNGPREKRSEQDHIVERAVGE
jgi:hypothetical protein